MNYRVFFRSLLLLLLCATMAVSLVGCGKDEESTLKEDVYVEFNIREYGSITLVLYANIAPITVSNFAKLVGEGFYDGLTFHRIADLTGEGGYIIQGGDPKGDGTGSSPNKITGEFSANGIANDLSHKRGVISMARSNDMNSASCQFFICAGDCSFLDGNYAAFGEVIEGMNVVDAIANVFVDYNNRPFYPIILESAKIIEKPAQ